MLQSRQFQGAFEAGEIDDEICMAVAHAVDRRRLAAAGEEIVVTQSAKISQGPLDRHEEIVGEYFDDDGLRGEKNHIGKAGANHADDGFGGGKQPRLLQQGQARGIHDGKAMRLQAADDFGLVEDASKPVVAAREVEAARVGGYRSIWGEKAAQRRDGFTGEIRGGARGRCGEEPVIRIVTPRRLAWLDVGFGESECGE